MALFLLALSMACVLFGYGLISLSVFIFPYSLSLYYVTPFLVGRLASPIDGSFVSEAFFSLEAGVWDLGMSLFGSGRLLVEEGGSLGGRESGKC